MYDTNFIINTYDIKRNIISGNFRRSEANLLYEKMIKNTGKFPRVFNIETTNHCNMKCIMCQRTTDFDRPLQHMDMKVFNRIVEQIEPSTHADFNRWMSFVNKKMRKEQIPSENNFYYDIVSKAITLHGFGEPLLDPMLPERVETLTKKNIPSYFSCNPNNIRIDFIKELFEARVDYIKFAMDSLDDERAKEIRGRKADFTKAYQLLINVLDLKKKMNAGTVIVITMLDFTGDFGPGSEAKRFLDLWEDKDVYAYVKSADNRWLLKGKRKKEKVEGKERSHYTKQYCEYPWTSMTILADGSVVACTQDVNGLWKFGNVKEKSLKEIWNSTEFNKFRQMQILGNFPNNFICHKNCDQKLISYYLE